MIKTIISDFSRVLLNTKDTNYLDSLNALYKKLSHNENFHALEHFKFNQEFLDFLSGISHQYDLYIFTTGTIQNDPHFKNVTDKIFKRIFTVEEVGFPKNDKKAYETILNQLSLNPDEVLFIDDQADNTNAAREAGLKTIQFIATEQVINDIQSLR